MKRGHRYKGYQENLDDIIELRNKTQQQLNNLEMIMPSLSGEELEDAKNLRDTFNKTINEPISGLNAQCSMFSERIRKQKIRTSLLDRINPKTSEPASIHFYNLEYEQTKKCLSGMCNCLTKIHIETQKRTLWERIFG